MLFNDLRSGCDAVTDASPLPLVFCFLLLLLFAGGGRGGGPTDDWFRFYEQGMWKLSFILLT